MTNSTTVKYFSKQELQRANQDAIANDRNRSLVPEFFDHLKSLGHDDSTKYPVVYSMLHNDCEVRCVIAYHEDHIGIADCAWLDVEIGFFNQLPTEMI